MLRAFGFGFALWCTGALAAQTRDSFVLLLLDPSGGPLANATGVFRCEPPAFLPALRDIVDAGLHGARPHTSARSDANGTLRWLSTPDTVDVRAIAGLVTAQQHLGAVVGRLQANRAQKLQLLPMAEVKAAGGGPFLLYARALLPTGETVELPPQVTSDGAAPASHRLPAGHYEVWAKNKDGWTWQRLSLHSGPTIELQFPGAARTLRVPKGARVHPANRPDVDLLAGGTSITLLGAAARAPLVTFVDGFSAGEQLLPDAAGDGPLDWPRIAPPATTNRIALRGGTDEEAAMATLFGLSRTAADTWRVFAICKPQQRVFTVPQPPRGDAWLLLVAPGHAAIAAEWSLTGAPEAMDLKRGQRLVVRARDEGGLPITDLAIDYVPERMEPATIAGHSDPRGAAYLGTALGPGVLRVSDPRFANQAIELDTIPADGISITVATGSSLRGVAKWDDGTPARGVVVTLRDPAGVLRPAQRVGVTGEDGSFAFTGLREQRLLVLFAASERDGRTWSAKLDRLLAGGEDVELVLRNEDPQLGPDRRH